MNTIMKWLSVIGAVLFGLYWLRRDAKQDQKAEQAKDALKRVKQANEIEQDIDRLTPDERRERLRNGDK